MGEAVGEFGLAGLGEGGEGEGCVGFDVGDLWLGLVLLDYLLVFFVLGLETGIENRSLLRSNKDEEALRKEDIWKKKKKKRSSI